VPQEHIGVLGHHIKARQCFGREVAFVEGDDDLGLGPHGDSQYVAIIGVGQSQHLYEGCIAGCAGRWRPGRR
jgi:hypothetical protein